MNQIAVCTIAAKSELALARVIATSWHEHHPEIQSFVLLADEVDGYFDPKREPFTLIELSEIEPVDVVADMCDRYGRLQLSYALTPFLMSHLLDQGFKKVLFFKQESLIRREHFSTIDLLDEYSIVLTPHITAPREVPDAVEWELTILKAGVYNGGFVGVSDSEQARAMLAWWQLRLVHWCQHQPTLGMHWEQAWLSLVPTFYSDTYIIRDPEASIGHWNLPERGDVDARLVRPSGHIPSSRNRISRYNGLSFRQVGTAAEYYKDYRRRLARSGNSKVSKWPWAFEEPDPDPPEKRPPAAEEEGFDREERAPDHSTWQEALVDSVDGGIAICTIFGKNHLALARVLSASVAEHHPDVPFFAMLSDHPEGYFDPQAESFPIIGLQTVGYGDQWLNADEGHKGLAPQLKPYVLSRLLKAGFDGVLFLDADMLLVAPIQDVLEKVQAHTVTVFPHILDPLSGPLDVERELVTIRAGAYNGGALGVSAGEDTKSLLDWWADRMHGRCVMDRFLGIHHDQRWMHFIPSFVEDVHTVRDPSVNIGHWNLPERMNVSPRLLHFSGYRFDLGDQITYYDKRLTTQDIGELGVWWSRYSALLQEAGFEESQHWPYAFGRRPFHPASPNDPLPLR